MKKISCILIAIAILLSDVMFFVVAYAFRGMLCGIEHSGFSAPAATSFLYAIPFLILIAVCVIVAFYLKKRQSRKQ